MKPGVPFKKHIHDATKWIVISSSILGILLQLKFYQPFILAYFLSTLIISSLATKIEKKSFSFPLIYLGIPWILLVIIFFNISFNENYILFFIPFQILTFGGLIFYFAGYLFEFFWGFKKGFLMKKWRDLPKDTVDSYYKEIKLGVIFLPFFHLISALTYLSRKDMLFAFEQAGIGLLFFVLLIWFFTNKNSIKNEPKKIVASIFFINLIMFSFDLILSEMLYLVNDNFWPIAFYFPFIILIQSINVFVNPKPKNKLFKAKTDGKA